MKCNVCRGTGHGTQRPDGLCVQCRGTGYYQDDEDYVTRHHAHMAKRAALNSLLRTTHGKNGLPALPAIKGVTCTSPSIQ